MTEGSTFVLVACSGTKAADVDPDVAADDALPAKDLYRGQAFEKSREYAETIGAPWAILSGKHGLVRPDERLTDYDAHVRDRDTEAWRAQVVEDLGAVVPDDTTRLMVLASRPYIDPIHDDLLAVVARGGLVYLPLDGLPIGTALARLNELLEDARAGDDGTDDAGDVCARCGRTFPRDRLTDTLDGGRLCDECAALLDCEDTAREAGQPGIEEWSS